MSRSYRSIAILLSFLTALGCGSTRQHTVTEQLLSSDAVDRAVSQIDFSVLKDRKVYLDTSYVQPIKNIGFVNDRYIVSALRQQMAAAGCLLQESAKDADVIVEPRVGALGTELHEVVYGIPSNNLLASVASIAPNAPQVPAIPEISVAKKNQHRGAAKIAVFAYESESRDPLWQSGVAQAESRARDVWVLGAGPFQNGTIYDRTHFAGSELELPLVYENRRERRGATIGFEQSHVFAEPPEPLPRPSGESMRVRRAGHEEEAAPATSEREHVSEDPLADELMEHLGESPPKAKYPWYNFRAYLP